MALWSYNTTPMTITRESPFTLTYGYEAMVYVEIGAESFMRDYYNPEDNEVNKRLNLDLVEETRASAHLRSVAYQQRTQRYNNTKVKTRPLKIEDLVFRRMMPNMKVPGQRVFGANWEGPYQIRSLFWEETTI